MSTEPLLLDTPTGPEIVSEPPHGRHSHPVLTSHREDHFQTPPAALQPLLPHIRPDWIVWEPAAGRGNVVDALCGSVSLVIASDTLPDHTTPGGSVVKQANFLTFTLGPMNCIITNPPYSLKDRFLARCYGFQTPFALLLPLTALEGMERQKLYRKHGLEVIIPDRRINFETPSGEGAGAWFASAWFASAWFTWGLGIGQSLTFWESPPGWCAANKAKRSDLREPHEGAQTPKLFDEDSA
jgi:hypothetical protein